MEKESKLPKELFEYGENKIYRFINLKGEEVELPLGKNDYLSPLKCPIDGTNYVMVDDGVHGWDKHCYCCGGPFIDFTNYSEEQKEEYLKKEFAPGLQKEIEVEKLKIQKLERLLEITSNRNSEILKSNRNNKLYSKQNNLDNLSSKIEPTDDPFYNTDPKFL